MVKFYLFHGTVTAIDDFQTTEYGESGCYQIMTVKNMAGSIVNFVISPTTYFVEQLKVSVGDTVTGYYDGNAPTLTIYPPQYQALIVVKSSTRYNVKVDFFNNQFVSSDNQLKLNISPRTQIVSRNGQSFTKNPANRNLIVIYGATTRSIPAQTTPYKIIVWCSVDQC